ncbi:MAG: YlmC/YmxH family sporulation protein [Bacilli bacterium]|nr:YlmC/YmxH family sporulation protein [Bacilli bacterium]
MRLSDLQQKEVVNVIDGKNLGKIIDAEINAEGQIEYFIVEQKKMFQRVFSGSGEILITFKNIKKIGSDVILVEYV